MIRFILIFLITSLILLFVSIFVSIIEVIWKIRDLFLKEITKKDIDEMIAGKSELLIDVLTLHVAYDDIKTKIIASFIITIIFLIVTFFNFQLQAFISLSVPISFFSLGLIVLGIIVRKSVFHKLEKENLLPIFPFFKKTLF